MAPTVTPQTVERIYQGHTNFQPTVQVLDVKKIQPNPGQSVAQERFRLVISDGTHFLQAMLATQLNGLVANNQIQPNGLLSLQEFICNEVQGKKIVIVLRCDVVSPSLGHKVGDPVEYGKPAGAGAGAGMAPAAPARPPQAAAPLGTMSGAPMAYQPKAEPPRGAPGAYQPGGGAAAGGGAGYRQSAAPVVRQNVAAAFVPIADLNPYQNRWTIKARVTNKTDIKRWSNAKGEGTLFSIDLLDENGGEIRAAFFKEACEKFFPVLQQGKVYTFSGGRLKVAQRQYSSIRNEYEITFDQNSHIEEVQDEGKIQTAVYNFKKINEIEQVAPNATIDLIGVVKAFTPESTITTKKDGREVSKRELTIADDSGTEVRLTLWGEKASNNPEQWEGHPIVAFKGVKVSDYNGRSLGSLPSTQISVQPDLNEAAALHNWWYTTGSTTAIASISSGGGGGGGGAASFDKRNVLSQIKEDQLGFGEKPDYVEVKATITYFRNDPEPWYKSCTSPDCKRKVTEQLGSFHCEKCQRSMQECAYRYILSLSATDASGSSYITAFDDVACQLLGKTAEELNNLKANDMQAAYESCFQAAQFKDYVFRLRVKAETVNDEQRVKATAMSARPLNYVQESRDLIQAIKAYA